MAATSIQLNVNNSANAKDILLLAEASANTQDDPFALFGQSLKEQGLPSQSSSTASWPNSPSPLPTTSQTAAELTSKSIFTDSTPPPNSSYSFFEGGQQGIEDVARMGK